MGSLRDPDDLKEMLERLQGDLEDEARRGHGHITRKPCPGCGQSAQWPYRNADHVCAFCRRLLQQAIEARLYKPETSEEFVIVSERDWETRYMEGEYESHYEGSKKATPRHQLEVAMHNLSLEVSQPAPAEGTSSHRYLYERQPSLSPMSWRTVRRIRKSVAKLLGELDLAIRDSLTECAQLAEKKGQNVLRQLAAGSMSIADLNEANARLARKAPTRRKRKEND